MQIHASRCTKVGIKVFVLSGSKTGYLQQVCVYYGNETQFLGKATQLVSNDHPHTVRVIQMLVEPFHDDLYIDWFYTSPHLAMQ